MDHWKARQVDLTDLLHQPDVGSGDTRYCTQEQDHGIDKQIDHQLIRQATPALESKNRFGLKEPLKTPTVLSERF